MTSLRTLLTIFTATTLTVSVPAPGADAGTDETDPLLRQYLEKPDDAFALQPTGTTQLPGGTIHTHQLTSQTWREKPWVHDLVVAVPDELRHTDTMVLVVGGGRNHDRAMPSFSRTEYLIGLEAIRRTGARVAVLSQVPNQPLWGGLNEDDLIARTFAEYLKTRDPSLPLLFPMVKSVVRAMDALEKFDADGHPPPKRFIVTGASKRGWTTYLSAAMDDRISAIAPMVFDILNLQPQLDHQLHSFGAYSEQIRAYEDQNLFEALRVEPGRTLGRLVDPFTYREKLTMPKLILLGTNDPYWTVDATRFYFDELPGANSLFYVPNAGHSLSLEALPPLIAFINTMLEGRPMPELSLKREDDSIRLGWQGADATGATLWSAESGSRDFRQASWTNTSLRLREESATAFSIEPPDGAFTAWYAEVQFQTPAGQSFGLTTRVFVEGSETDAPVENGRD